MVQHQAQSQDMVVQGSFSFGKYQAWVGKLKSGVVATEEDEAADLEEVSSDSADDDDCKFEQIRQVAEESDVHTSTVIDSDGDDDDGCDAPGALSIDSPRDPTQKKSHRSQKKNHTQEVGFCNSRGR
jgi:hypothetical protein